MNNIVLIGFMGAGKTTVGTRLSYEIDYDFLDTDEFFETATGCKISDFFKMYGEEEFRKKENLILSGLLDVSDKVISTGGGIVEKKENRELLKKIGTVVYLKSTVDRLWARVGKDPSRPLSLDLSKFNSTYRRRQPLYEECADIVIDTDRKDVSQVIALIKEACDENFNH